MPANPFSRACLVAGCPNAPTFRGRCATHGGQVDAQRSIGTDRQIGRSLYSTREWRELRAVLLALHATCECPSCVTGPRREWADVVHHIRAHHGDRRLFFARENLMLLSAACHARLHGVGGRSLGRRGAGRNTGAACRAIGAETGEGG